MKVQLGTEQNSKRKHLFMNFAISGYLEGTAMSLKMFTNFAISGYLEGTAMSLIHFTVPGTILKFGI